MKTVTNLLSSDRNKRLGNHRVEVKHGQRLFYYYYTAIVTTNDFARTFKVDNGGFNTPSTNRAINAYRRELTYMGYTEEE